MTLEYRNERENILANQYQDAGILPLSETFNRAAVDALLAQTGCAGLRIYYGMDETLKVHAILVAVDELNADILPSTQTSLTAVEDVIMEISQRCPDVCPPASPLNS
ncbi:MAG: hypothetical protein EOO46_00125 [Flavobacterium sp.]|nr:MAG: hypothetical protein EOO46_00125 [Flavobacterium sp.]